MRTGWPGGDYNYFAAILFFLPQRLFESVGVRLIHLVRNIFSNPGRARVEFERSILLRNLLHADQDFHRRISRCQCTRGQAARQRMISINERAQDAGAGNWAVILRFAIFICK